jgi:hypothetical protein
MALPIRINYAPGSSLAYSVERLADGLWFDFADSRFRASPATPTRALAAGTGAYLGRYSDTLAPTSAAQWANGAYAVVIHDAAAGGAIGEFEVVMYNGDAAPVFPAPAGQDPLGQPVPGAYAAGSAGHALGLVAAGLVRVDPDQPWALPGGGTVTTEEVFGAAYLAGLGDEAMPGEAPDPDYAGTIVVSAKGYTQAVFDVAATADSTLSRALR